MHQTVDLLILTNSKPNSLIFLNIHQRLLRVYHPVKSILLNQIFDLVDSHLHNADQLSAQLLVPVILPVISEWKPLNYFCVARWGDRDHWLFCGRLLTYWLKSSWIGLLVLVLSWLGRTEPCEKGGFLFFLFLWKVVLFVTVEYFFEKVHFVYKLIFVLWFRN